MTPIEYAEHLRKIAAFAEAHGIVPFGVSVGRVQLTPIVHLGADDLRRIFAGHTATIAVEYGHRRMTLEAYGYVFVAHLGSEPVAEPAQVVL